MNRRKFLALATGAALLPFAAMAGDTVDYAPGVVQNALNQGKTVLVDYSAVWCPTCRRQHRVLSELRSENPAYDANILFVRVDWDRYRRAEISTALRIPRQSTLVLLRGNQELGRIVAGTRRNDIRRCSTEGCNPRREPAIGVRADALADQPLACDIVPSAELGPWRLP